LLKQFVAAKHKCFVIVVAQRPFGVVASLASSRPRLRHPMLCLPIAATAAQHGDQHPLEALSCRARMPRLRAPSGQPSGAPGVMITLRRHTIAHFPVATAQCGAIDVRASRSAPRQQQCAPTAASLDANDISIRIRDTSAQQRINASYDCQRTSDNTDDCTRRTYDGGAPQRSVRLSPRHTNMCASSCGGKCHENASANIARIGALQRIARQREHASVVATQRVDERVDKESRIQLNQLDAVERVDEWREAPKVVVVAQQSRDGVQRVELQKRLWFLSGDRRWHTALIAKPLQDATRGDCAAA
jgi:hypothetical protein